jgi:WD40 repeat protein
MSSSWQYQDEAYVNVTIGIHKAVEKFMPTPLPPPSPKPTIEPSKPERTEPSANELQHTIKSVPLEKPENSSQRLPIEPSKSEPIETPVSVLKQQQIKSEPLVTPEVFSWHCICTLTGHTDSVLSIAISPDGETLTSGSADKTIKLWNLKTGDLLRSLIGHVYSVTSIAISPDGETLASGSADKTIKLWKKK